MIAVLTSPPSTTSTIAMPAGMRGFSSSRHPVEAILPSGELIYRARARARPDEFGGAVNPPMLIQLVVSADLDKPIWGTKTRELQKAQSQSLRNRPPRRRRGKPRCDEHSGT
jgi:hypothetical protein